MLTNIGEGEWQVAASIEFGELLRVLRQGRGLSQVELAHEAGFSQSYISALESGKRRIPTRNHIAILAKALNVDSASARELFESAGFLPINININLKLEYNAKSETDLLAINVDRLMNLPSHRNLILRDILNRLEKWDLY